MTQFGGIKIPGKSLSNPNSSGSHKTTFLMVINLRSPSTLFPFLEFGEVITVSINTYKVAIINTF